MRLNTQYAKNTQIAVVSAVMALSALIPVILPAKADAAQVTARSITMSASALSATTVDYEVSFKVGQTSATTFRGFVVEFCDDSPLPGIACDTTAGRIPSISSVASPISGLSGATSLTGTWTGAGTGTGTFKMTNATGDSLDDNDANPVRFKFQATNPTNSAGTSGHTFYARIYAYVNDTGGSSPASHTGGVTTGTYLDNGGIALSTANQINITTRVQEKLVFCVNKTATTGCTAGGAPVLDIGTGTPKVIDNLANYDDTAVFGIATNAATGAIVRMRGDTLKSGSNDIDPAGAAAIPIVAGTEMFGLNVAPGAGIVADSNYLTNYGFDTTNTLSGFGDTVANTNSLPIDAVDSTLNFRATASLTTAAGLYSTNIDLIATGTY
jgi:hypothetical protein